MPNAVTHVLIPIIILEIIRDYIIKDRKKFPLHYILIAGIAGLLPDIDIMVYWIMNIFAKISLSEIHRTFSHTLFLPLLFLILGLLTFKVKIKFLSKHKLRLRTIFFVITFGVLLHLFLDWLLIGEIKPLYPLNNLIIGLNLVKLTPFPDTIIPALDAILLIGWLIHEEFRHKISDFI